MSTIPSLFISARLRLTGSSPIDILKHKITSEISISPLASISPFSASFAHIFTLSIAQNQS